MGYPIREVISLPYLIATFLLYSFFGFLLEVVYARLIHCPKKDRKCFLFLPLCPVYGFGALAILSLPSWIHANPLLLILFGGLAATAVEYLTALFYEFSLGVKFWDYSHLPGNLSGRVCLTFTFFWGVLALALVYWIHPLFQGFLYRLTPQFLLLPFFLVAADGILTLCLLHRTHNLDSLRWYAPLFPGAGPVVGEQNA